MNLIMIQYNDTNLITKRSTSSINSMDSDARNCESDLLTLIMKIQSIFLLLFGFLANLCSFAVLIHPRLRRRPTFTYLAFLSLSNAFLSLIHAFFTLIGVYFGLTLENLSLFIFCRLLNRFLIDFLTHFSLLTLTAVDLDRCRTVTSKTVVQQYCGRSPSIRQYGSRKPFTRVCLIVSSFAVFLFLLNLHWLVLYGYKNETFNLNERKTVTMCTIEETDGYPTYYAKYLTSILPIIELILFGIFPFSISFVTTIIIIRHVSIKHTSNNLNKCLKQSRRRFELHLSLLLISLNCVYILFTTPHNIYSIYLGKLHSDLVHKNESDEQICSVAVMQKSLDLLQQCYFMSTFFLYILTNKRFREEFYRLMPCFSLIPCRNKNRNDSQLQITNYQSRFNNHNNHTTNDNGRQSLNQNFLIAPMRKPSDSWSSISDVYEANELVLM